MAETIRRVDYFYVTAPNKPGEGVRMLSTLKEAGISLLAFSGFPSGRRSQIDFVPEDTAAFRKAARKAGWKLSPRKTGFLIEGKDQLGALLNVVSRLAEVKINVTAATAVCAGQRRYGALLWVKAPDVRKAAKVLASRSRTQPLRPVNERESSRPPGPGPIAADRFPNNPEIAPPPQPDKRDFIGL